MPRTDSSIPGITIIETDSNGLIVFGLSSGAPSSTATAASKFAFGGKLVDTTTGLEYYNAGTVASPSWNSLSEISSAEIASNAVTSAKLDVSTIQYAEVSITNAQMLALRATPKELVAAPGSGKVLEFVSAVLLFDYTGAYTETADNMAVKYTDGSGAIVSETIEATGFVDATADTMTTAIAKADVIVAKSGSENKALVLHNTGDGEYGGGNASNAIRVKVAYRVHTTGF